jgi:two-component system nitrate/nitrite response regulator NarL
MGGGLNTARVFVAEDHPLYRDGIIEAVRRRPDLELAGWSSDGRDALARIQELEPDVAVLDVKLPSLNGIGIVTALHDTKSRTRTVVLSAYTEPPIVFEAVQAGANAYVTKDSDRDVICDAIAAVHQGRSFFSEDIHHCLAGEIRGRRDDQRPKLTGREREVLQLASEGWNGPEIARKLFLSRATVKTHLSNIYDKLEVPDRASAVAKALREGVLQ